MGDAWVGLLGALIGATAALGGAAMTTLIGARNERDRELRHAAAELIARARHPAYVHQALKLGVVSKEHIAELVMRWGEDMARAHTNLVIIGDRDAVGAADLLWQRATDHLLALLGGDAGRDADSLQLEVDRLIWDLQARVAERYGSGSVLEGRALD